MFKPTSFEAMSEIVVLGYNLENADYTNPTGACHGYQAYIRASNDFGDTRIKSVGKPSYYEREVMEVARKQADAMNVRLSSLGKLPVDFANWAEGRAIYGSEAYEAYGQADEYALEMREVEEEGWY
jgi:hypothetical protein